jgi:hypothetical protein
VAVPWASAHWGGKLPVLACIFVDAEKEECGQTCVCGEVHGSDWKEKWEAWNDTARRSEGLCLRKRETKPGEQEKGAGFWTGGEVTKLMEWLHAMTGQGKVTHSMPQKNKSSNEK